jgi:hypothetical protein
MQHPKKISTLETCRKWSDSTAKKDRNECSLGKAAVNILVTLEHALHVRIVAAFGAESDGFGVIDGRVSRSWGRRHGTRIRRRFRACWLRAQRGDRLCEKMSNCGQCTADSKDINKMNTWEAGRHGELMPTQPSFAQGKQRTFGLGRGDGILHAEYFGG